MRTLRAALLAAIALVPAAHGPAQNQAPAASAVESGGPVIVAEFTNSSASPSHWVLTLHPDGKGHFRSQMGAADIDASGSIRTPGIDRDIQLGPGFAASAFATARRHSFFNQNCESHLKVAFQGMKTLRYSGPDGKGSCSFNYSRDREIEALGNNLVSTAETIVEGERLEMLLAHDPLGLDKEIRAFADEVESGQAQQICAIRSILERLAGDDRVLEIVRKRARELLAKAAS